MAQDFDLYEFPEGYSGRKTYVSVQGHSKSIPIVYTYRGTDGRNHIHPDFGGDWSGFSGYSHAVAAPMFIRDIGEYTSPLDGSRITSRSQHREHMRSHGVIEVGNERMPSAPSAPSPVSKRETMRAVKEHLEQVKAMPEAQYQERIAKQQYEAATAARG